MNMNMKTINETLTEAIEKNFSQWENIKKEYLSDNPYNAMRVVSLGGLILNQQLTLETLNKFKTMVEWLRDNCTYEWVATKIALINISIVEKYIKGG